ncbi:MAG TPA: succinate dehydrogenase, cytochrome b556 subunit [Candidatus Sulfomarinibacteraceae bacterium]|nr:succinate dehydrogenase, cytochrome b556 subunit [Candidatus Sulfomarinibacteraceae bacterium]
MSSFMLTLRESIRYRGRIGHYSWLAHRLSGLGILAYLIVHVWDTANATYNPQLYEWSVTLFKHPLFGFGEIMLLAALLFHAFNGIRIALLDFKPEWWRHQETSALWVWGLFAVAFLPIAIYMIVGIVNHCAEPPAWANSCWSFPPYPLP